MDLKISTSQLSAIRRRRTSSVSLTSRPRSGTRRFPATTRRITGWPIQTAYPPSIRVPPLRELCPTKAHCDAAKQPQKWYKGLHLLGTKYYQGMHQKAQEPDRR